MTFYGTYKIFLKLNGNIFVSFGKAETFFIKAKKILVIVERIRWNNFCDSYAKKQ